MEAVERLRGALTAAGLNVPGRGTEASVLDDLERELAPLRLPAGLRALWERVPVGSLPMGPQMDVAGPFATWLADVGTSWWLWRAIRDRPGLMPEALMPVVRYGSVVQLVELASEATPGGRVFEWRREAGRLEPCHPSVDAWLAAVTNVVAEDSTRLLSLSEDEKWLQVPIQLERELRAGGAAEPIIGRDPGTWPEHWRAATRAFDDRRPVRAPELSISEFVWDMPERATVSGLLGYGAGGSGPARNNLIDGTGWLDVWLPADLPGFWTTRGDAAVELEVIPYDGPWPIPGFPELGWAPPHRPQATATGLRLRMFG